jgi:hypothetical protein
MRACVLLSIAVGAAACGDAFTAAGSADGGDDAATDGADGGAPDWIGCSDGTREAFVDRATHPSIAGCSGGFDVPSTTSPASLQATCGRRSGNSSDNPLGNGCSVEDLCSAGWRVCIGHDDVALHSGTHACDVPASAQGFWLTRQTQDNGGNCTTVGHNNIVGCASGNPPLGHATNSSCTPLDSAFWYSDCAALPPWACGDTSTAQVEADVVHKSGPDNGGVICCRNL